VFTAFAIAIAVATAMIYRTGPIDTFANTPEQYMSIFGRRVVRIDFLYLGTITRASGLLLGAALATMWTRAFWRSKSQHAPLSVS
jgi:hypothetical protein